ncbi:ABC transporter permease [Streptomyces sp. NPDC102384]|uniref:ABC transporter permease n=1 Tax=Streptomyces sp. NPDC102384 TaxID=3366166 RepID=UPI0038026F43
MNTGLTLGIRRFALAWRMAIRITALNIRARLEYRAEFLLSLLLGAIWQASVLIFVSILLARFPGMGGWSQGDILLLASMRLTSHGLHVAIFANINFLHTVIQEGRIDGYLLRPLPVFRQVLLNKFHVNAIGDLLIALTLFGAALSQIDMEWTAARIFYLFCAILGGTMTEAAAQTALSSTALRFPVAFPAWSGWLEEQMSTFGNYPLSILPDPVRGFFTFVIPVAFISYFPASVLTGHSTESRVPYFVVIGSPVVGLCLFIGARLLWVRGLRSYQGIGG